MYVFCMESTITDRKLGIEIEAVIPIIGSGDNRDVQQLLAEVLSNHGMRSISRSYCREPLPFGCVFAVEHDSSLRDESKYQGLRWSKIEMKTYPMTWANLERILPQALDILNYFGARVNYSCGLHVHHHLPEVHHRPRIVRNLSNLWWRYHPVMYGLVAPSRLRNVYCTPPREVDAMVYDACYSYPRLCHHLYRSNRYSGLNLMNLADSDRLTVEWRIHQGTTDLQKIRGWVLATQRWTEHAVARSCHYRREPTANTRAGLNALLVMTGLKSNSRIYCKVQKELRDVGRYLVRRWTHFNAREQGKGHPAAA